MQATPIAIKISTMIIATATSFQPTHFVARPRTMVVVAAGV
jgi:hypothetical protein